LQRAAAALAAAEKEVAEEDAKDVIYVVTLSFSLSSAAV